MGKSALIVGAHAAPRDSWQAMIVIGLGQALLSFNFSALLVSINGISASFHTPATTVGTAIVIYSLAVAGFVMLGAKLGQIFGSLYVFRASVAVFGAAMAIMTISPSAIAMIAAQGVAGLAAAALDPALLVLIANNYRGPQQEQALGLLGSIAAMASVLAFLLGGALGVWMAWCYTCLLLAAVALLTLLVLSGRLNPVQAVPGVRIDALGVALAVLAITLISLGSNNLTRWGLLTAGSAAPVSLLGLSPAPIMIGLGILLGQSFVAWSYRRMAARQMPLVARSR